MPSINASEVVNSARLNRFHYLLVFWCSFIMLFDGYDLVIYGSVLPHVMSQWSLSPGEAGALGASSMVGMMFGAVTLGTQADRFGRRRVILFCVALFSVAALANAFATGPTSFSICRFLTGAGLGGVVPNLVTILKEMSPGSCRNRLINLMLSFFAVGGLLSGVAGVYLIPVFGWHSPFYIAGLSLLALPLLYKTLPESVAYLLHRNRQAEVAAILHRVNPEHRLAGDVTYVLARSELSDAGQTSISALFGNGRTLSTLMLWLGFGMCMLMVYGLNTWLPKLMSNGGYPLGSSIVFLVVMNVGSLIGTLISGVMADRWGCKKTLVLFFALAAASISLLGIRPDTTTLYALLLVAGGSTVGCLSVVHTLAADLYPTQVRSTGVSMAAAVGRCGAVAGPLLGGFLLSLSLPFEHNFVIFAVPGVIAVFAVLLVAHQRSEQRVGHPKPQQSL
ncbi:aromatic acid/H+ symport family MFS transporter [Pseudomonas sp. R5(2019)]|uniref:MFS transporter n=1 Tax=Pseudomonas sp. R5(2019) TaxID=2697566 RepID=UPI00141202A2|nr:aromatic acid/H+ symport family MFS transporter [Pseudomonas sp. R5(2019)]NBA93631.1 MFS transporter [Pseudomonas sp. R5(2019)]